MSIVSPPSALHVPFLDALDAPNARATSPELFAGFLALRLVDRWFRELTDHTETDVCTLRGLIAAMPPRAAQSVALLSLVNVTQRPVIDAAEMVEPLFRYGQALEAEQSLDLAADVYASAIRFAHESDHQPVVVDALLRLAYCQRSLGVLDIAEATYLAARTKAKDGAHHARALRADVGRGNVFAVRGNLPEADAIFEQVISDALQIRDPAVLSIALQDQSIVAKQRGQMERAVMLAFAAHGFTTDAIQREQIVGNLGVYFIHLGRFQAARDALLIQEATAITERSRVNARIGLLSLAARTGDRALFEYYRDRLRSAGLCVEDQASFLIEKARGLLAFGLDLEAAHILDAARQLADRHHLNRVTFEIEELCHTPRQNSRTPSATSAPTARVEQELRRMAAELAPSR